MEFNPELTDNLRKDLIFIGISLAIVIATVGAHNIATPDSPKKVGFTEVTTDCFGVNAGACIGIQKQDHTVYNYENYTEPEPGTENFYRLVESELMLQANGICEKGSVSGMGWTSEASYQNKTADEWLENENVELLKCENTYYRNITATQ